MEGLGIFVVIILLNLGITYLKRRGENRGGPLNEPHSQEDDDDYNDSDDETVSGDCKYGDDPSEKPQQLQDLIRKFREEQAKRDASAVPSQPETIPVLSRPVPKRPSLVNEPLPQPVPAVPNRFQLAAERYANESFAKEVDETTAMEISDEIATPSKATLLNQQKFAFNLKEARKGFLWSEVLNRPRCRY